MRDQPRKGRLSLAILLGILGPSLWLASFLGFLGSTKVPALTLLAAKDADLLVHAPDMGALLAEDMMGDLLEKVGGLPETLRLLGFEGDQSQSFQRFLQTLEDEDATASLAGPGPYLDSEFLFSLKWRKNESLVSKNQLSGSETIMEQPFASLILICRPKSRRVLAMARAATQPFLFRRFVRNYLPPDRGIDLVDGILNIARPFPESLRTAKRRPIHGLSCGTAKDLVVIGSNYEEVKSLLRRIRHNDTAAARPAQTKPLSGRLSSRAFGRLRKVIATIAGPSLARSCGNLWRHAPRSDLRFDLDLNDDGVLKLGADWDGLPWAPGPLPAVVNGQEKRLIVTLPLALTQVMARVSTGLAENFDARDWAVSEDDLLAADNQPKTTCRELLQEPKWQTFRQALAGHPDGGSLVSLAPTAAGFGLRYQVSGKAPAETLKSLTTALQSLSGNRLGDWQLLALPALAGFSADEERCGFQRRATGVVFCHAAEASLLPLPLPKTAAQKQGLFRFSSSGDRLAVILKAIQKAAEKRIETPTLSQRDALRQRVQTLVDSWKMLPTANKKEALEGALVKELKRSRPHREQALRTSYKPLLALFDQVGSVVVEGRARAQQCHILLTVTTKNP